jgi:hypothetical protein
MVAVRVMQVPVVQVVDVAVVLEGDVAAAGTVLVRVLGHQVSHTHVPGPNALRARPIPTKSDAT